VLGALLHVLLIVGLLIVTGYVLVRFGVVLGSPWYARLSNELELLRTGRSLPERRQVSPPPCAIPPPARAGVRAAEAGAGAAIGVDCCCSISSRWLGSCLRPLAALRSAVTLACLDFFDYPLERRRISFWREAGCDSPQLAR